MFCHSHFHISLRNILAIFTIHTHPSFADFDWFFKSYRLIWSVLIYLRCCMNLSTYEHALLSIHLDLCFQTFNRVFFCIYLIQFWCIFINIWYFDTTTDGISFQKMFFADMLIYKNVLNFCILILYLATLLNTPIFICGFFWIFSMWIYIIYK